MFATLDPPAFTEMVEDPEAEEDYLRWDFGFNKRQRENASYLGKRDLRVVKDLEWGAPHMRLKE